jgi:hypothetical protein
MRKAIIICNNVVYNEDGIYKQQKEINNAQMEKN